MRGRRVTWVVAVALAVVACSQGGGAAPVQPVAPTTCAAGEKPFPNATSYAQELSTSGQCGDLQVLRGAAAAGAACAGGADCAPSCCACPPGTTKAGTAFWIAACADKKCASVGDVCCSPSLFAACN